MKLILTTKRRWHIFKNTGNKVNNGKLRTLCGIYILPVSIKDYDNKTDNICWSCEVKLKKS